MKTLTKSQARISPPQRKTLTHLIYEQLSQAVASAQLWPGEKLVIDTLARQLRVSITPLREALVRLQRDGLIYVVPYSGMYVSKLSLEELRELHEIRGVQEGYATRVAADKLGAEDLAALDAELEALDEAAHHQDVGAFRERNLRFHDIVIRRGSGPALLALIQQLKRNTDRYSILADKILDDTYLEAALADHHRLVRLLKARSGAEAEDLIRHHALAFVIHLARCHEAKRQAGSIRESLFREGTS